MMRFPPGCYVQKRFPTRFRGEWRPGGERMWIRVHDVRGGRICGTLANDPVMRPDLRFGERVCVRRSEVLGSHGCGGRR